MNFTEMDYNALAEKIIQACTEVHNELGPGLLQSVYENYTIDTLKRYGLIVNNQVKIPVTFQGKKLGKEFIIDLLVEDTIILELKTVDALLPIHEAQLETNLKLADKRLGLLINFNVPLLKQGIKRKINGNLSSAKLEKTL